MTDRRSSPCFLNVNTRAEIVNGQRSSPRTALSFRAHHEIARLDDATFAFLARDLCWETVPTYHHHSTDIDKLHLDTPLCTVALGHSSTGSCQTAYFSKCEVRANPIGVTDKTRNR